MFEASNLALLLHDKDISLEDLILGSSQKTTNDIDQFRRATIELFDVSKLNIIVSSENHSLVQQITLPASQNLTKDPYFNFMYQLYVFKPPRRQESFPEFTLSLENRYIPFPVEKLDSILSLSKSEKLQFMGQVPQDQTPKLLAYSNYHEIWISQSRNLSNEVFTSFQIRYSQVELTPVNCIGIEILGILFESLLSKHLYLAELANYSWAIYPNYNVSPSFSFTACGPKHGFKYFLHDFVEMINKFLDNGINNLGYKNFTKAKLELRSEYDKLLSRDAMKQALAISILALESGICPLNERMEALDIISVEDLQQLCNIIQGDQSQVQILTGGNVDQHFTMEASDIINILSHHKQITLDGVQFSQPKSFRLKHGMNYAYIHNNVDEKDTSDQVYHYIQLGHRGDLSFKTMACFFSYLLSQIIYELRTRKQIGYVVLSGLRYNKETIGLHIYVSSSSFTYSEVMLEIDQLLFDWELQILNYTQADLDKIIKVFLEGYDSFPEDQLPSNILYGVPPSQSSGNFSTNDKHFKRHQHYWEKILTGNFDFSSNTMKERLDKNLLQNMTIDLMITFFRKYISIKSSMRSTMSIFISSQKGREIQEYTEAKKTLQSLLSEHSYSLTPVQINMLLQEHSRDISSITKHLQACGYNIKQPKTSNLQQLFLKQLSGTSREERRSSRIQQKCVRKFGRIYEDKDRVTPSREVTRIDEIHEESSFYPTRDRYALIRRHT
ncbi:putative protease AXL1 [Spathaspora sp. JA1]|nr:putative protease AXL1 [Spathaspora sp. JA1]